ncbi:RND transporter [Candidatus Tenderia electrophaga]|jgi:hypothetical protein|uniref:RND transporter n=1 Tax=Candidatus Tenderia electrophaga TaxID=1748243 RepID=A0A0S2TG10_9GAMM|nr:RND transporter [Candidatus Tenderia electrophaga]
MTQGLARWVTAHPIGVILTTLILVILAASGARLLGFSNDYRLFFSADNPQLQAFEELQQTYTKSNNVVIVIAPERGQVFNREVLSVVEQLTEAAWQTPYSTRVDSITNFQHSYGEGDDLIVEQLVEDAPQLTDAEIQAVRRIALNEPLLVNKLIAPEGDVTAINVAVYLPEKEAHRATPEVMEFIQRLVTEAERQHPQIDFYVTGIVAMNHALQEYSEADLKTLVPATFLVVVIGLALLLRSATGTLSTVLVVCCSTAAAMGLAGWLGIILTPSSIGAPTIIATLAIADCVHVLTNFLFARRDGNDKQAAMVESLCLNFKPIVLTSVTTAVGLLSLNFSDAPPLRDLGNIAAMGVMVALLLSVTLLPALMMILPVRRRPQAGAVDTTMAPLADFVIARRRSLLWGVGLVIVILAAAVPQNRLNDEFHKFFSEDTAVRQATEFIDRNLTGIYEIHYSLAASEPGGISAPAFLETLQAFTDWYRQQPHVIHVHSLVDIMKRLNQNLHGDDPDWYRIPGQRDLAAQYLLLYEMSLPYGLDLNDRINIDKSATRVTVTLTNLSSRELLDLEARAQAWLREHAPPSMQTEGASSPIMFAHIGERNIRSSLLGTAVALVLISFILIFALRSLKLGLISLVPNLVPALMAFGVWALSVGQIGFAMSIVASMSLGIIVDDTVHFLSKYLHARREKGMDAEAAIRYTFATVGRALWVTSLVLIAGFLVLSLSDFEFNSGTGALMALTIFCALLADFFFLPPLLMTLEQGRPGAPPQRQGLGDDER